MPLEQPSSSRQSWAFDLIALTLMIGLFYFIWLGSYPLFTPDEGRYSEVAREMLASGDFITPRVNGVAFLDKPALYYWLQALSLRTFGLHEWAVRFFPALYGILGCLVVYISGRRLFNRLTGLVSAIILASTPLYFACSHYANLDLEIAVLITTSLLTFLMATHASGRMRTTLFMLAYAFAGFGFLTKGLIAIVFPVMIIGLWIMCLSRWRLILTMHLGLGVLLMAAIILPWFILVQQANPEFLHFFFVTQQVTRFLSAAEFNNPSPVWFYIPIVFAGFLPWSAFMIQALIKHIRTWWRARDEQAAILYLMIWAVIVLTFFSIPHSKTVSYILPIFPPLALLTGKYLADGWYTVKLSRGMRLAMFALIIINAALAGILVALPDYQWIELINDLSPTLFVAGGILALSSIALIVFCQRLRTPQLFALCAISNIFMLLVITFGAVYTNLNTAKPLATQLKTLLRPTDTVVNYFKFYQDVPMYLDRTIILVADWQSPDIEKRDNWVRELWYSMPFQNTDEILLNEKTFWKRWHSKERMFVFVNDNYFNQFQAQAKRFYWVGQYRDIILVSNKKP